MRIVLAFAALAMVACAKSSESVSSTSNTEFRDETLYAHDGCTVHRFEDQLKYHYYVTCAGQVTTESTQVKTCGKSRCTEFEQIPTIQK